MSSEDYCFRPLSRYGWFPTQNHLNIIKIIRRVSVPSRGMGGFLQKGYANVNGRVKWFPSPLEVWVVSYPISCTPKGNQHTR